LPARRDNLFTCFPPDEVVRPIFDRYAAEFPTRTAQQNPTGDPDSPAGVAAVLGYPLLLHFTFRLLAEAGVDRKELIESPTSLLRKLTDYATEAAQLPSDRQQGAKILGRLSGSELRVLLRRTAAHMTALGQEGIGKAELEKRLRTNDLVRLVRDISKDKVISALLVSFYFKGGNTALGCEFTHKAFREYLFAEEIVETLKVFARSLPEDPPERSPALYWRDFDEADPRRNFSENLAALLGPQWLSPEVVSHFGSLLQWEIARSLSLIESQDAPGSTAPLSPSEWRRVRTILAYLWDWWADGVHLRPQPREDRYTGQLQWERSLAERLVPRLQAARCESLGESP
jgi:hypothetical protein